MAIPLKLKYSLFTRSTQVTLFVNGNPVPTTTTGINKGANQLYIREIMPLHKGDLVSLRNHSSNAGTITVSVDAGGALQGINAVLLISRIAALHNLQLKEQDCKIPRKVQKFKKYLMCRDDIMPSGSDAYWIGFRTSPHTFAIGETFKFPTHGPIRGVHFQQGTDTITVHKDGIYKLFVDINGVAPSQTTVFVNGIPETSTTEGTDSGAGQSSMRQIIALKKGDTVTLVNWQSITPLLTSLNAGGTQVGIDVNFTGIKIAPLPECYYKK